jgi:hypothetical protein
MTAIKEELTIFAFPTPHPYGKVDRTKSFKGDFHLEILSNKTSR